ncbi:hypothetical protein BLA6993_04618 [Burkholderia lata]|uniref:Uncharacterized protein n=1 Tax=Burkholderia lata (strain ATCC 17760 / DSM 23089 / LMG 22485 / NCIMB 9086 / R18194 / 383) TaxID=482957 RepID=A0A833PZZ6_BURL3|nr:hypothetical protein [Burkholderia lata]KAF1040455.1 MAG: hypothetical protein GAK33_00072 [Burkholderia lata]VWB96455.1 hypothetical protein BLA6993_04618 [Burkholderia lata]
MAGVAFRSRARRTSGASGRASERLPAGLVIAAHLAGMAAGIAAIAALATLLALLFR